MLDWITRAIEWVATATDAYLQTELPEDTFAAFVTDIIVWGQLLYRHVVFILGLIQT